MPLDSTATITPAELAVRLIDPTATAYKLSTGEWYICGDHDQALAIDAGHLDLPEYLFATESEAWAAAENFLREHTTLTA